MSTRVEQREKIINPLPIQAAGRLVVASRHGGCTADEQVTVAITITQSTSGAIATGETGQTCTGKLQNWTSVPPFANKTSL